MIDTLTTSLILYKIHRNKQYYLTEIEKRRALFLTCCITAVVTFGVIMFLVRY